MPRARPDCGNPLLRDWMAEWMEEARSMQSKSFYTFKKAYDSLCACPTPFAHPNESQQLNGIGPTLASRLEKKMINYCEENGLPVPQRQKRGKRRSPTEIDSSNNDEDGSSRNKRARAPPRPYIPRYRTGPYAILLALLDFKDDGQVAATKNEIIREGQAYCDTSMDLPEPGSSYTAWSGIKLLREKGYVWQNGSPARFTLTETGEQMAEQLRVASNDGLSSSSQNTSSRRRAGTTTIFSSQYTDNNDSQISTTESPEVDLSLYVLDPEAYRRERAASATMTTTTTPVASASTEPEVDLSLYVLDPDAYMKKRATTTTTATTSAPAISTSSTSDVDLSLYVLDPDAYRKERAATSSSSSSSAPPAVSTPSTTPDVDLSLYVLDPDAYRKERTASTATPKPARPSTISTSYSQSSLYTNLDDDHEPTIDLSLGTSDRDIYRQKNTSSTLSHQSNTSKRESPSNSRNSTSATPSLYLPSKRYTDSADEVEVITLLSPTPSPPNSPVHPTTISLNSSQTQDASTNIFQYTYLDTSDNPVRHVAQAAVDVDGKRGCLMYKIRYSKSQKQHSRIRNLVDVNHSTCTAYFLECDADVLCPGLPARPLLPLHNDENQQDDDFWPDLTQSSQRTTTSISNSQQSTRTDLLSQPIERNRQDIASKMVDTTTTTSTIPASLSSSSPGTPATNSTTTDIPMMVSTAKQQGQIWQPEDYTIVMILDNREVKMKTNREYIQDKLMEKGVTVEKRALDVGDVLWVAKHVETKEEMYLDVVLERKRMDDLVSSVKDGRFYEQKYRLKQSASRKVFYVVEEYNKEAAFKFGAQAIQTAMSSVQAVDQFYLKRTGNLDETIDYLVCLTKMIGMLYKNTKLREIPIRLINRTSYVALKKGLSDDESEQQQLQRSSAPPPPHHVIPYTIFNELNSKSGSSTLQDLYTKMLMTIRGVNAEKAGALIRAYPTPYHLLKAMDEAEDGRQLAVRATKEGISRRRWGLGISERLWEVWGKQHH